MIGITTQLNSATVLDTNQYRATVRAVQRADGVTEIGHFPDYKTLYASKQSEQTANALFSVIPSDLMRKLILFAWIACVPGASGWGVEGHNLVARLAAARLTPQAS